MSDIVRWFQRRLFHLWIIARYDSTAFTEILSGLFLLLFRGILLVAVPERFWPFDVSGKLLELGLNENRWGAFLFFLGAAQIILAGSLHHFLRLLVLLAIMASFVVVGVSYAISDMLYSGTVLSIICITAFYTGLLIRVLHDRADERRRRP
jgi:hypothetical protein